MDTTPPSILSVNPTNKSVNVPVGKTIKFTFTEKIKENTNWIELVNSAGKAIPFKSWITDGKHLMVDPKNKLPEAKYKVILHTGSVTDEENNHLSLASSSFTVGTSPIIKNSNPKNNAVKVARTKTIKVTFSENIKAGSKYKTIVLVDNKGKKASIKNSISGKTLTVKHSKLKAKTKYTLKLYTNSITDKAGNPLKAKTITFTTSN